MSLPELRVMLADRLRDTAGIITPAERDAAIAEAVKRYSADYPAPAITMIVGDGVTYTFTLPPTFEAGASITDIEYPFGQQVPSYLTSDQYQLYRDPSTTPATVKLRLYFTLGVGEQAGVNYTARHVVTDTVDTIPPLHQEWVAWLAAAICCRQLAAYYAQTSESTLGADAAYFRSRSAEYLALSKVYEQTYVNEGVMVEGALLAASINGDLDVTLEGGFPRFYHPNVGSR